MSIYTTQESPSGPHFSTTAFETSKPTYSASTSRQHHNSRQHQPTDATTEKRKQTLVHAKMPSKPSGSSHRHRDHTKQRNAPPQTVLEVVVQPPSQTRTATTFAAPVVVRLTDRNMVQKHINGEHTIFATASLYRLPENQPLQEPGTLQGCTSKSAAILALPTFGGGSSASSSGSSSTLSEAAYFIFNDLRVTVPGSYYLYFHIYHFSSLTRRSTNVGYSSTRVFYILDSLDVTPSTTVYENYILNALLSASLW
ncbi:hypothetical protein BD289DRAFT_485776 [Coniella lustricola]|uniref:Velvet factor-domain-containing protein n=1 Tax=Coniella lustricola TaxID=2025994 RepID=A0A2T2ZXF8_9PEZI|nr:hypothetical protein BD289DRAFT_485776 [Coniella lustricola]